MSLTVTRENQEVGERGERVAEMWLTEKGWTILDRRFRSGHRDIDIVAARREPSGGRMVAFVEVKARRSADFGGPFAAVGWRKQRELCRSALIWMVRFRRPTDQFRFDVIGILLGGGRVRVQHIENAFLVRNRP